MVLPHALWNILSKNVQKCCQISGLKNWSRISTNNKQQLENLKLSIFVLRFYYLFQKQSAVNVIRSYFHFSAFQQFHTGMYKHFVNTMCEYLPLINKHIFFLPYEQIAIWFFPSSKIIAQKMTVIIAIINHSKRETFLPRHITNLQNMYKYFSFKTHLCVFYPFP